MLRKLSVTGLAPLVLASAASAGEPCDDLIGNGTIAVFSSLAATSQCIAIPAEPAPITFYVLAILDGESVGGLIAAEFRVEVSPSTDDLAVFTTANPNATVAVGNPLVSPGEEGGCSLGFVACQTGQAGDAILLYTVSGFYASAAPLDFRVKQKSVPSTPAWDCPRLFRCNPPLFSPVCLTPRRQDLGRDPVASISFIRPPNTPCEAPCVVATNAIHWGGIKSLFKE